MNLALVAAYVVGYALFAASAICIWGFVYRPCARTYSGGTWDNEEIVKFACLQALIWPVMTVLYIAGLILFGIYWTLNEGLGIAASKIAKTLPREQYYSGFRRKARESDRYR